MEVVRFIIYLLIVTAGATLLSYGSESFARRYGANFTGSILLALITTLPEYMFVIWATLKGEFAVAIGSAVGASTLLVTLGYGSVILFATTNLSRRPVERIELSADTRIDAYYLMATALVAIALALEGGGFDLKDGLILVAIFGGYIYHVSKAAAQHYKYNAASVEAEFPKSELWKGSLLMALGGAIVFFVSERFVDSMIELAHWASISPVAVAVVLGPLASEMPEKMAAYITVIRDAKLAEISICNFLGSKVNHNSLLFGTIPIIAFLTGQGKIEHAVDFSFALMTALTMVATISVSRRKLLRWESYMFLLLYAFAVIMAFVME